MHLTSNFGSWSSNVIFVLPPLHIKLGILNKILDALDLVIRILSNNHDMQDAEDNLYSDHLAACLSKVSVRRERYYAGKMSRVPCTNLMKNMENFCTSFFDEPVSTHYSIPTQIPEIARMKSDLLLAYSFLTIIVMKTGEVLGYTYLTKANGTN